MSVELHKPESPDVPPARWWHPLEGRKVVCTLCPRECHIPENSRGFCFVRANVEGKLELTTWGRSTGFCVDPIEKKPLNHFLPGTPVLSFGTAGCNLGCKFCQNWDISKSREIERLSHLATPEAIVEAAVRTGCRSIAFTYNDPVIWAEYAIDVARVARERNIKTVAVTAGYISPEARREFYDWMDAANVDLKGFTETFYRKLTQTSLQPVLDTLVYLKHSTRVWFEITNLIIPGENDSPQEIEAMCRWIMRELGPDVPIHFTAFHPDFKMLDTPRTPHETLIRARQQALDAGIRFAYVGNVDDVQRQSTYCPSCGNLLIERNCYALGRYGLTGNRCSRCSAEIPGVFDEKPGSWGRKRLPVTIDPAQPNFVKISSTMAKKNKPSTSSGSKSSPSSKASGKSAPAKAPSKPTPHVKSAPAKSAPAPAKATAPASKAVTPSRQPAPAPGATPGLPTLTQQQDAMLVSYAYHVAVSTILNKPLTAKLPEDLARLPVYGTFISLLRPTALRSCRGRWNAPEATAPMELGALITAVAKDAATLDPRFPAIHPHELPHLGLSISWMYDPVRLTAKGEQRVKSVTVGEHGLIIAHPQGRGLLLPHVATDAKTDARGFLDMVCRKANLPASAWKDDEAVITTFRARKIDAGPVKPEIQLDKIGAQGLLKLFMAANQGIQGKPTKIEDAPLIERHTEDLGIYLQTTDGVTGAAIGPNHSLTSLTALAVRSAQKIYAQGKSAAQPLQRLTLLWQPVRLSPADYPQRHGSLQNKAVLVQVGQQWSLIVPKPQGKPDKIAEALAALKLTPAHWKNDKSGKIRVTAFAVVHCSHQPKPVNEPNKPGATPAARSAEKKTK